MNALSFFRFITSRFPPSFFLTRKMLLRNYSWAVSAFWIAPFFSNSDISWSTSRECRSDIFIVFGDFYWTGRFVNGIWDRCTIDKISCSRVVFSHYFTNCDSLPASDTFGISSVNNFLTTGCIKVIDVSGTGFELLVQGTSFRFLKETFIQCCWTSMLKFPCTIMLKRTLEIMMFMLVWITWFPRVVIAPSAMRFILTVWKVFSKGDFFSPKSLKTSNDFFLDFSVSIIWDRFFQRGEFHFPSKYSHFP